MCLVTVLSPGSTYSTGTPGYSTALNRLTAPPAANMASPYLPARMVGGPESQTTPTLQEALSNEELEAVLKVS